MVHVTATEALLDTLRRIAAGGDATVKAFLAEFDAAAAQALAEDGTQPPPRSPGQQWAHELVPWTILEHTAALETGGDVRRLLRDTAAAPVLCAEPRPPNPHRAAMRRRLRAIDHAVQARDYNSIVSTTPGAVPVGLPSAAPKLGRGGKETVGPQGGKEAPDSFGSFMRDVSIGLDVRLMSLSGAVVGYYVMHLRGAPREQCIVAGAVGAVVLMFVDAFLIMTRLAKADGHGRPPPDPALRNAPKVPRVLGRHVVGGPAEGKWEPAEGSAATITDTPAAKPKGD